MRWYFVGTARLNKASSIETSTKRASAHVAVYLFVLDFLSKGLFHCRSNVFGCMLWHGYRAVIHIGHAPPFSSWVLLVCGVKPMDVKLLSLQL